MTNYSDLKLVAEACEISGDDVQLAPDVVLGLIAENASLKGSCMAMGKDMGKVTRERNSARAKADRLKVEVELLKNQVRGGDIDYDLVSGELAGAQAMLETAYSDIDQLKAVNFDLHMGAEAAKEEIARLKGENEGLFTALKGMTSMYGYCWDIVDGGLLCMQQNVQRFEDAHEAAQKVIAAMSKGNGHE